MPKYLETNFGSLKIGDVYVSVIKNKKTFENVIHVLRSGNLVNVTFERNGTTRQVRGISDRVTAWVKG